MSFMQPQLVEREIDTNGESGIFWRLSAPGYLDCTDWSPADSPADAVRDLLGMHGDQLDVADMDEIGSWLDGFDEFFDGYLIGLAFTARKPDLETPAFCNPGGDIREVVDADEIRSALSEEQLADLLHDCICFCVDAIDLIGDRHHDAGSDFHLTRNGHGAGFWDGDWEHGHRLTELAKPYGTLELTVGENGWAIHSKSTSQRVRLARLGAPGRSDRNQSPKSRNTHMTRRIYAACLASYNSGRTLRQRARVCRATRGRLLRPGIDDGQPLPLL